MTKHLSNAIRYPPGCQFLPLLQEATNANFSTAISEKKIISMDCEQIRKEVKLKHEMVTRGFGCYYFFRFAYNLHSCDMPG